MKKFSVLAISMYTGQNVDKEVGFNPKDNPLNDRSKLKETIKAFIEEYEDLSGTKKYKAALQRISDLESTVLSLETSDLYSFDTNFSDIVKGAAKTFVTLFYEVCDSLLPEPSSLYALNLMEDETRVSKRIRLQEQLLRENQIRQLNVTNSDSEAPTKEQIPRSLIRRYSIQVFPEKGSVGVALRSLGARQLGCLVSVKGIVTKVSTVKLQLLVAAYVCNDCGNEVYNEATSKKFNPVIFCPVPDCLTARNKSKRLPLVMNNRRSKFRKYQEITLQELPDHTLSGNIPEQIKVETMDENTTLCKGGDTVTVTGVLLGEELNSMRARMQGNKDRIPFIEAFSIHRHSKALNEESNNMFAALDGAVDKLALDPDIYDKLASSLAPEIFGMLDVKKALLLQLVSGSLQYLDDGLRLRGDVNICMVGDPGVAKSQLLKAVSRISPRTVYTTGKGSSAVGLTASVTKDKYSGDMILEPGALVLADNGICCIDEFDKMTESDRTAIHEVMEQQTVSIAKAGITTTLNARTSILAAANPVLGRYNRKLSAAENMNLPAALLSRFDLVFILLDTPNAERDQKLAEYVAQIHEEEEFVTGLNNKEDREFLDIQLVRAYISQARKIQPSIPNSLIPSIVEEYVTMRKEDKECAQQSRKREQLTPRQLLSILRLSHGLAKIRLDNRVTRSDVQEAIRLIRASKSDLYNYGSSRTKPLTVEELYNLLQSFIEAKSRKSEDIIEKSVISVNYQEIKSYALSVGATAKLFDEAIAAYTELNIWRRNESGTKLLVSR